MLDFAGGKVRLVTAKAFYGGPLVGHKLREIPGANLAGIDAKLPLSLDVKNL